MRPGRGSRTPRGASLTRISRCRRVTGRGGPGEREREAGETVRAGVGSEAAMVRGADRVRRRVPPTGPLPELRGRRDVRMRGLRGRGLQGVRHSGQAVAAPELLPAPGVRARAVSAGGLPRSARHRSRAPGPARHAGCPAAAACPPRTSTRSRRAAPRQRSWEAGLKEKLPAGGRPRSPASRRAASLPNRAS